MEELVEVTIACACPNKDHPADGDVVSLHSRPPLALGADVLAAVSEGNLNAESAAGRITELYCRYGIASWTILTETGPRPVDRANLRWFVADFERAYPVAEKAAELYSESIFRPLVARMSNSSLPGPTDKLTSAKAGSRKARPRR